MPCSLSLIEFLKQPGKTLDVRSPSEFLQGHIPGSYSLPLFSDSERSLIGTAYKKQSRQEAVELALWLLQPRIESLLDHACTLLESSGKVLCWRGGMRSGFVARLLETVGYRLCTLQGGYKAYRRWALHRLDFVAPSSQHPFFYVLGGLTGSRKTAILHALRQKGEQLIDLEELAHHRGSAFGGIGMPPQPSQEQFENELAFQLESMDWTKPVWVEDESRLIGRCHLPHALYQNMNQAPLFFIQCSKVERLQYLLNEYQQAEKKELLEATARIAKRLGSQLAKEIQQLFEAENREAAFEKLLSYYDKSYSHPLSKRKVIHHLSEKEYALPDHYASILLHFYDSLESRQRHFSISE